MRRRLLVAHFLRRLVDNDLVSPDADRHEVLAFAVSALVGFGTVATLLIATKYLLRPLQSRGWTAVVALDDTFLWTGLSMLVMAAVALAAWDSLSLDARDTEILGPLPVPLRAVVAAQAAAVALFAGGIAVGLNAIPSLVGPLIRVQRLPVGVAGLARLTAAHAATTMAAGLFGFAAVFAMREALRAVLGPRWFQRASAPVHGALVVACATSVLLLPLASAGVERQWLAQDVPAPPPLWFVGLHETLSGQSLIGIPATTVPGDAPRRTVLSAAEDRMTARYLRHGPAFRRLARTAAWSVLLVFGAAAAAWAWNSRRLPPPLAVERARIHGTRFGLARALAPSPLMRAGFEFTFQVLARSAPHRITIATTAGIAFACAALGLSGAEGDAQGASLPSPGLLAVQSLVLFAVAGGLRHAIGAPASLDASATFVLADPGDYGPFREGVKRAGIVLGCPALVLLFPAHVAVMGVHWAAWHAVAGILLLLVVAEAALSSREGLPLVEPAEGPDNKVVVGLLAAMAALAAARTLGWLEHVALSSTTGTVGLLATLAAAWLVLRGLGPRTRARAPRLPSAPAVGAARLNLGE